MKANIFVEYAGKQMDTQEIIKLAKASWVSEGHKIGEIKTMNLYVKPEDSASYVVINDDYQCVISM